MSLNLKIRQVPELELLVPSVDVVQFGSELAQLSKEMLDVMYEDDGIGLAGPQIGYNLKLIILGNSLGEFLPVSLKNAIITEKDKNLGYALINPRILVACNEKVDLIKGEGCLSLMYANLGNVERNSCIKLEYQNLAGQKFVEVFVGKLATIIQHEMDHLYGILYPARMKLSESNRLFADYVRKKKLNLKETLKFYDIMVKNLESLERGRFKNKFGNIELESFSKEINLPSEKINELLDSINRINKGRSV